MTLTTHAITGAAIASVLPPSYELAFVVGFASHFILDAIPHWDYKIISGSIDPDRGGRLGFDRRLVLDLLRIGADAAAGIILPLLFFAGPEYAPLIFMGAAGGMLPDFLQFLYLRFPRGPLVSLQRLHRWCHTEERFAGRPAVGIATQVVFAAGVIILFRAIAGR